MPLQHNIDTIPPSHYEHILAIKRLHLFMHGEWQGFSDNNIPHYLHIISHKEEFHPRFLLETDARYKQIIPYLIFTHNNNFFLMQRSADASEKRLQSKMTLGIGGHIRKEDLTNNSVYEWAQREFYEEVAYTGSVTVKHLGIINDDSNEVGKVHLGIVLLLEGNSPDITVKSELQSGALVSLTECAAQYHQMETWSKLCIDYFIKNSNRKSDE